jgi:hypothetical protein
MPCAHSLLEVGKIESREMSKLTVAPFFAREKLIVGAVLDSSPLSQCDDTEQDKPCESGFKTHLRDKAMSWTVR